MERLDEYLDRARVRDPAHRARLHEVCAWTAAQYPSLMLEFKWNQPMFTDHGTFILSYAAAKPHMSVAPERACLERFADEVARAGYARTKELMRIPWESPVDCALLARMIEFNIADKATYNAFWRK